MPVITSYTDSLMWSPKHGGQAHKERQEEYKYSLWLRIEAEAHKMKIKKINCKIWDKKKQMLKQYTKKSALKNINYSTKIFL